MAPNTCPVYIQVIHLKHVLQLVEPLKTSLEGSSDTLLKAFYQARDCNMISLARSLLCGS